MVRVSAKAAVAWLGQQKVLRLTIYFISFWIAVSLQTTINMFLADKISQDMLNFVTIFSMWILAFIVFPVIMTIIIIYFFILRR